jgi:hypothetical protein
MQDPFLKALNATVNNFDYSFGITLIVGGGVITGNLISSKTFFNGFADTFSQAWPGGPSEDVRGSFAQWGQPETASIHENFIHLKDARYVSGKDIVPTTGSGMLWRGSIDSISGFSLGAYNAS